MKILRICDKYQNVVCWPISILFVCSFGFRACEGGRRWFESGEAGFGGCLGYFGWFGCFHGPSCRCKFPYCNFFFK